MNPTIPAYRISDRQLQLWRLSSLEDQSPFWVQCVIAIAGDLDTEKLKRAINKVAEHYEILRTTLSRLDVIKVPYQIIHPTGQVNWRLLRAETPSGKNSKQWFDLAADERMQSPKYEHDPVLRAILIIDPAQKHYLLLSFPSIFMDRLGQRIIVDAIERAYNESEFPPTTDSIPFVDLAEWQNTLLELEETREGREYWERVILSQSQECNLPFGRLNREGRCSPEIYEIGVTAESICGLRKCCSEYDLRPQLLLLTCWHLLLEYLTGGPVVVGFLSACRHYAELKNTPGLLEKYLPVYCEPHQFKSISAVVENLQSAVIEMQSHEDYLGYCKLKSPDSGGENWILLPYCFEYWDYPQAPQETSHTFNLVYEYSCTYPYELKLVCEAAGSDLPNIQIHYNKAAFSTRDIERIAACLKTAIAALPTRLHDSPSAIEFVNDSLKYRCLDSSGRSDNSNADEHDLATIFQDQVSLYQDRSAIRFEDHEITYGALNLRASCIASHLRRLGVKSGSLVLVMMERSIEQIIAMIAVLQAGGAFVPLDPDIPTERLRYIVADANPALIFIDRVNNNDEDLRSTGVEVLQVDENNILRYSGREETLPTTPNAKDAAYVIYTSGSTGRPKGVVVEHRNVCNYVRAMLSRLDLSTPICFATPANFSADLGFTALFPSLLTGGLLLLIPQQAAYDPEMLSAYLSGRAVDCLKCVPSLMAAYEGSVDLGKILPEKVLVLGGETCLWSLADLMRQAKPECRILNHYGPTEATIGAVTFLVEDSNQPRESGSVPIGYPLANTRAYVLDPDLRLAERFVPSPFEAITGERLYRTGDLVSQLDDGNLEFLCRIDDQIKIRGYRVEPGEVAAVLRGYDGIKQAVVIIREDVPGEKKLVGYIVSHQKQDLNQLRQYLQERLPDYMIPGAFIQLSSLPLLPNGKVDRKSLPAPEVSIDRSLPLIEPRSEIECQIAAIWREVLQIDNVGISDNFFDLGGHSLALIRVLGLVRGRLKKDIIMVDLFEYPTIASLADFCNTPHRHGVEMTSIFDRAEARKSVRRRRRNA